MKKIIKFCFRWGSLTGYLLLVFVLIFEACMPGNVSASHSTTVGDIVNDFIDVDFEEKTEHVNPTEVKIINEKTKYSIGENCKIDVEILPKNASNKSVIYAVDDTEIANINNQGYVTFFKEGKVTITVSIKDTDISDTIQLQSMIVNPESIEIVTIDEKHEIDLNETEYLKVKFNPSNTSYKDVIWSSSDDSIATIDANGKITPIKVGTVIFTAKTFNGLEDSVEYQIIEKITIKPVGINVTYEGNNISESLDLLEQTEYVFNATLIPSDTTNTNVLWISSNEQIATVVNGKVKTKRDGIVEITAISFADENIKCSFTLNIGSIEPEFTIKNINENNKLTPNASVRLELDIIKMPTVYSIKYESSDTSVCTIGDDGYISTIKKGNVTIKVICEANDGKKHEESIELVIENDKNTNKIREFYHLIRKGIGHFGAFFVLAILSSLVVILFFKRKVLMFIISAVGGFLVAFITELIQLFVPGRGGNIKDVGIDFAGFMTGTIIMILGYLVVILIKRKVRKNENKKK